ncbi:MAG: hypothetical protein ACTSRR_08500, partial [Candidatus Heimdallarchaeaceae archaeon]
SLILTVLRLSSYDFLRGESNERRKLEDYIPGGYPSHILIEWIFNNGKEKEFFLTGMMLVKNPNKSIKRIFYSLRYPSIVKPEHTTFDNFPLETPNTYLSHIKIIEKLNEQKKAMPSQKIRIIRDNISDWLEHLDKNQIDTKLAKTQVRMNIREGAQAEFLEFDIDNEFIIFIVETLHQMPNEENLEEIKHAYNKIRELPIMDAELKLIQTVIEKLEKGKEIEQEYKNQQKKRAELNNKWSQYHIICNTLLKQVSDKIIEYQQYLSELQPHLIKLQKRQEQLNYQIPYLSYHQIDFQLKDIKLQLSDVKKEKEELDKIKKILEILPTKIELESKKKEYKLTQEKLSEEIQPLIAELSIISQILSHLLANELQKIQQKKDTAKNDLSVIRGNLNEIRIKKGRQSQKREYLQREIQQNNEEIWHIEDKEKKIKQIWQEGISLEEQIKQNKKQYKELTNIILEKKEEIEKNENKLENLESQIMRVKEQLLEIENKRKRILDQLQKGSEQWQSLVDKPIFRSLFGDQWSDIPIDYFLLSEANKKKIISEKERLSEELDKTKYLLHVLEEEIQEYKTEKRFLFDSQSVFVRNMLKENNVNSWIGWEYLNNVVVDSDEKDRLAEKLSLYLDGIVIAEPNLDGTKRVVNKLKQNSQLETLTKPILISTASILNKKDASNNEVMILNPGLNWRYDNGAASNRFKTLQKQYMQRNDMKLKQEEAYSRISKLLYDWDEFLRAFPEDQYYHLEEQRKELENKIAELKKAIDFHIKQKDLIKNKLKNIKVEIKSLEANKERIGSEIQSLEKFQILYEQKIQLIEKNQVNIRNLREVSQDLIQLQNSIDELEKKEHQLSEVLSQLNNQIEQIRREMNEILLFEKSERIPKNEIEIKANEMSLDEWREKYKHIKAIYTAKQSRSKVHQELERLEGEIKKLEETLLKYCNSYKIKAEEVYSYHYEYPDLNTLETIIPVKQEIETQITEKEIILRHLKSEREQLLKSSTELEQKFINRKSELDDLFSNIIKDKDAIAEQLSQLQRENEKTNKEIDEVREKISIVSKQLEDSKREHHELEDKLSIIIIRKRLLTDNSNKIEDVSLNDETLVHSPDIKLTQLKQLIDQCTKETDEYEEKKKLFDQQMEAYILDFRSLSSNIDQKLENKKIKEFIENFGTQQILEISTLIQSFTRRLNNLKEEIKAPKERLKNIVMIFVTHIKEIISKIRNLQSIKLEIPDLQYLNKKPIVKIKIQGVDDTSIEGTVNNYFQRLFSQ